MAFSGSQYTRLGPSATPRQLNGSFSGKTEEVAATTRKRIRDHTSLVRLETIGERGLGEVGEF